MSISGYEQTDRDTASGRSLEARVLLRSALRLRDCIEGADRQQLFEAVSLNHKLWLLFFSEIETKRVTLTPDVQRNILSLVNYVAQVTPRAFARDREALESLININRRIAAGLSVEAADETTQKSDGFKAGATV